MTMKENKFPSILKRYLSSVIDLIFIFSMMILAGYIFQSDNQMVIKARIVTVIILFFIYEPLFTSRFCTIGQKLTGIRVRNMLSYQNITLPKAYIRIIIKLFLGFISFFTIPFTQHKRAIHDLVVGSVVIEIKQ